MARLLPAVLLAAVACHSPSKGEVPTAWNGLLRSEPAAGEERGPTIVSDLDLRPYLPQSVLGRPGGSPQGSVTRFGPRSLSEVTRAYPAQVGDDGQTELKLQDARFEPHAIEAIRSMAQDATQQDGDAHPFVVHGAIGYALYREDERVAEAKLVIGGRFIASATVQEARDYKVAETALGTVDTLALSRLAGSN